MSDDKKINEDEKNIALIETNIMLMASLNGWKLTENVKRIATIKNRFFGMKDWKRCPCYPHTDTEHGCGSAACSKEILENGVCHCNLFKV